MGKAKKIANSRELAGSRTRGVSSRIVTPRILEVLRQTLKLYLVQALLPQG